MAKKSKHKNLKKISVGNHTIRREATARVELRRTPKREISYFTPFNRALAIDDNRRFHPIKHISPVLKSADLVKNDGYLTTGTFFDKIAFRNPLRQSVCRRRSARRRVIFALNLAKKGSGAKSHRFTDLSKISCKG